MILSNRKQWPAPVCCSFEGALSYAEGKRPSQFLPNQTNRTLLLFMGFSCPAHPMSSGLSCSDLWGTVSAVLLWLGLEHCCSNSSITLATPHHAHGAPHWDHRHPLSFSQALPNLLLPARHQLHTVMGCRLSALCFFRVLFFGSAHIFSTDSLSFWGQLSGKGSFLLHCVYE